MYLSPFPQRAADLQLALHRRLASVCHVGRTWTLLQADTGFIAVLHTWGQLMIFSTCVCT